MASDEWLDAAELAFNFAVHAREWFNNGTKEQKRAIAMCIGSTPLLEDGLVRLDLLKPFKRMQIVAKVVKAKRMSSTPLNLLQEVYQNATFSENDPAMGRVTDVFRPLFLETEFVYPIPNYQ